MNPLVSIVIPCRNEVQHIERCISSILNQDASDIPLEIIVADGMSDDGTREKLHRLRAKERRLRVVENPERIVSTGLNRAIREARGCLIMRMDVHTEYAPDYVRQCLAALEETGADNVGGPWVARGDGFVSSAIAAAFQSPFAVGGARSHDPDFEGVVDSVYLGCWRRGVFDRFGFFDEELVRNQDDEFNLRLTRGGATIWQSPRIRCWYEPRGSLASLFRQYVQYGYWKVRVIQKHNRPASVRHLVPGFFVALLIVLPIIGLVWSAAIWSWLGLVTLYLLSVLAAAVESAQRRGWKIFPILPAVFVCYHFAYGLGFLQGVLDFVVLGRRHRRLYEKLTRT